MELWKKTSTSQGSPGTSDGNTRMPRRATAGPDVLPAALRLRVCDKHHIAVTTCGIEEYRECGTSDWSAYSLLLLRCGPARTPVRAFADVRLTLFGRSPQCCSPCGNRIPIGAPGQSTHYLERQRAHWFAPSHAPSPTFYQTPSSPAYKDSHTRPAPSSPPDARTMTAPSNRPATRDPSAAAGPPPPATQSASSPPIPAETHQQQRARP
jgi:hypothetical protein